MFLVLVLITGLLFLPDTSESISERSRRMRDSSEGVRVMATWF